MSTLTPNYTSGGALTISLASLASSSLLTGGQESNQIDNTTTKYVDALFEGFITVGTTPTINTSILIYVWGSNVSLATTAKDVLDGVDSAETLTSVGVLNGILSLAKPIAVDAATSNRRYDFGNISVAQALGLPTLPPFWGVVVIHNTGVALHATAGNHAMIFTGIKYDVV
jgi:hypothetical protein